jgi:hypothetical protein
MSLQGKNFLTATRLKPMKSVLLLLPGHFLIQPLFQRFCQLGFGDVRINLLLFILGLCLHKQIVFVSLGPIVAAQHVSVPLVSERSAVC